MNTQKKNYVSQLAFSLDMKKVAVLLKLKGPEKLIGKLTGQGGVIERGETALRAATRESKEESDLDIAETEWSQIGYAEYPESTVTFFAAKTDLSKAKTMEAEPIMVLEVAVLKKVAKITPQVFADDLIPLIEKFEEMNAAQTVQPEPLGPQPALTATP